MNDGEQEQTELKAQRRQTPTKLTLKELPEAERFAQLKTEKKHFIDTIKLIAYRAETTLVGEVREALARDDDARALLRRLFVTQPIYAPTPSPRPLPSNCTVSAAHCKTPLSHTCANF